MAFGIMLLSGTNEVEEVTQETVEEVGRFAQYLQDQISVAYCIWHQGVVCVDLLLYWKIFDQMDP